MIPPWNWAVAPSGSQDPRSASIFWRNCSSDPQRCFLSDLWGCQKSYNVRPPSDVCWLTKAPVTIVINTINHSDIGVICTNWTLSWGPHIVLEKIPSRKMTEALQKTVLRRRTHQVLAAPLCLTAVAELDGCENGHPGNKTTTLYIYMYICILYIHIWYIHNYIYICIYDVYHIYMNVKGN